MNQVNPIKLNTTEEKACSLEDTTTKMPLSHVFSDTSGCLINEMKLFMAYFNCIPNSIEEIEIDCKKAIKWFKEHYHAEIKDSIYRKRHFKAHKNAEIDDAYFFIYDDLLINFNTNFSTINFLFKQTDEAKVNEVIRLLLKFKKRKHNKPEIGLIVKSRLNIMLNEFKVSKPKLNIVDNYNDDFIEIHQTIMSKLSKKNEKGIVLLHGKPGTGKTSYIRYLITSLKKSVIFLPPNMASAITNPDLINILIDNPNSIFVIEDAENIVMDREQNGQSPVSVLLNIADGLLADCLNIQIVCSFNTDISKIDKALMRKGRLIAKYEFTELEVEKAQSLSDKLGFASRIDEPMTLTAIYNQVERQYSASDKKQSIGFQAVFQN